ncbi:MAG: substrate-binding domain-containing protein [Herbinix sp.]|nr:substrate-binding domain-containing protein [Herbinix sp.]
MKLKKIISDVLVIIAALAIFIMWYNKFENTVIPATVSPEKDYKVYLITKNEEYQFWDFMNQGASDMANLLGEVTYIWDYPKEPGIDKQIEILNKAVKDGADAIILAPANEVGLSDPIKEVKKKGVKIIFVDWPANEEAITTLATDNYEAGKIAGENMILELELTGKQKGEIAIINAGPTTSTTIQRELGFRKSIETDGRFTMLETQNVLVDPVAAQEASMRMIKEYPDLVGLYATDEGTSVGMGNAIKEDNNRIIGVGFDKSDKTMMLLQEESLKVIIAQNPYTMGYLGTAQAFAALKGYDTGPQYLDTGVSVLRKR